jgi:hypothetical protein
MRHDQVTAYSLTFGSHALKTSKQQRLSLCPVPHTTSPTFPAAFLAVQHIERLIVHPSSQ